MNARILIVDDEPDVLTLLRRFLVRKQYTVLEAGSVREARELAAEHRPEVALVDHRLPDGTAFDVIKALQTLEQSVAVIVMTGHGTIDLAVEAMKLGAEHFLTKPVDLESLGILVERVLGARKRERREAAASVALQRGARELDPFLGCSALIEEVRELAEAVASSEAPVLIMGETGTGKGVLARWLHRQGKRSDEPFVDLNCSGLSKELAESELFGHLRGSFTNASADKKGLVEVAHRGTLFLDEIGDLDPAVQPKLLKVLEERTYRRVGETRMRHVDIRMIAATHRNLGRMTESGEFRSDLLFRINTISFDLPALRDRPEDIPALADRLLERIGSPFPLADSAHALLAGYHWPGNIRELRNVLERAALLCRGHQIGADCLRFSGPLGAPGSAAAGATLEEVERNHIVSVLRNTGGHVERAAQQLGVPRSSLYAKLKKYGIAPSGELVSEL